MKILFGRLYQKKNLYFEHDMMTCCFFTKQTYLKQKKMWQKKHVFMVERANKKILFENCKRFFKKEKILLKNLFLLGGSPRPLAMGLVSY